MCKEQLLNKTERKKIMPRKKAETEQVNDNIEASVNLNAQEQSNDFSKAEDTSAVDTSSNDNTDAELEDIESEDGIEIIEEKSDFDESEYIMSDRMISLFDNAIFKKLVLTGVLTSVMSTDYGIIAKVSYNANYGEGSQINQDSATVIIRADDMGFNNDVIMSYIRRKARGYDISASELEKQKMLRQYQLLRNMLGATIDFIPSQYIADSKIVIGDRVAAMKRRRRNFKPNKVDGVPRIREGTRLRARVLRTTSRIMVVDVSGYEVAMNARQISPMAVDIPSQFKPGDRIDITVRKIDGDNIIVAGTQGLNVDIKTKIHEYKITERAIAEVITISPSGRYRLRMPNGCLAISYYTKSILYRNPHIGEQVNVIVTGFSKNNDYVRCTIKAN